jgi:hypothetical protein
MVSTSQPTARPLPGFASLLGLWGLRLLLGCGLVLATLGLPSAVARPHRHHAHHHGVGSEIVGGTVVPQGAFPFATLMEIDVGNGLSTFCGASLIASRFVVTAAHCVEDETGTDRSPAQFTLIIGRSNITNPPAANVFSVVEISQHPGWDPHTLQDDVAVLQLGRAVPSNVAQPIPLVAANGAGLDSPGQDAIAVGWGFTVGQSGAQTRSPDLRQMSTTVISDAACEAALHFNVDDASVLCTQVPAKSTCQGDSGSPLFVPTVDGAAAQQATKADRRQVTTAKHKKKKHHHHHGTKPPPPSPPLPIPDATLIGVTSFNASLDCSPDAVNGFAQLSAPVIHDFVVGVLNNSP